MIAEYLLPLDIECAIKTAVDLWNNIDPDDLSTRQLDVLDRITRAREAEDDGRPPPFPPASILLTTRPTGHLWVLRKWDRHGEKLTIWADEDSALYTLAEAARESWDNLAHHDGVPHQAPTDDREAVQLYYGPHKSRGDEGYALYPEEIGSRGMTHVVPAHYKFPSEQACRQANKATVLYTQDEPDTLPCIGTAGVLTFQYLDPIDKAVKISIHLDTIDSEIVRPDGTVPLRVTVQNSVILDDTGRTGPCWNLLAELLDAATTQQAAAIHRAALAAGIFWECPTCQTLNERAETCCHGPGPCRVAQPEHQG